MKKIAIVDIDDTICDLVPELVRVCNKLSGKNMKIADWSSYDIYKIYGIPQNEYMKLCEEEDILRLAKPIFGANITLQTLITMGYDIQFLTARAWHKDAWNITADWLGAYYFTYTNLHVIPLTMKKIDFIKSELKLDHVDIIIDDNPTHVTDFAEHNIATHLFMPDQPWNREDVHLDKYRISNLIHILKQKL